MPDVKPNISQVAEVSEPIERRRVRDLFLDLGKGRDLVQELIVENAVWMPRDQLL
jgi:hypothetical protein